MKGIGKGSDLEAVLNTRLRGGVVIAGVGNTLRGDDGAGPRLVEMLEGKLKGGAERAHCVHVINCGQAPESYIGSIAKMRPDTVVVVDSASLGLPAGKTRILEMEDLVEHSFSTHRMSPALFMNRLKNETGANVFMLAVQPATAALGEGLSAPVNQVLEEVAAVIENVAKQQ